METTTTRCEVCGAAERLVTVMAWVGGRGHQERVRCGEAIACWRRRDAAEAAKAAAGNGEPAAA